MRIGSLFSGIGGIELGLERAGLGETVWQAESSKSCRRVLRKHWPDVPCYGDVRQIDASAPPVDVLCGGPPCQDLSDAGTNHNRRGLGGERSGLAFEMLRIIKATRPNWVIWENVDGAARQRWVPQVRRALFEFDYASVSIRVRACDLGAPHKGSRIFVVATTDMQGESASSLHGAVARLPELTSACRKDWGQPSSSALGMDDGVPRRMDRLKQCGNSVVPVCAELIGRMILMATTKGEQS